MNTSFTMKRLVTLLTGTVLVLPELVLAVQSGKNKDGVDMTQPFTWPYEKIRRHKKNSDTGWKKQIQDFPDHPVLIINTGEESLKNSIFDENYNGQNKDAIELFPRTMRRCNTSGKTITFGYYKYSSSDEWYVEITCVSKDDAKLLQLLVTNSYLLDGFIEGNVMMCKTSKKEFRILSLQENREGEVLLTSQKKKMGNFSELCNVWSVSPKDKDIAKLKFSGKKGDRYYKYIEKGKILLKSVNDNIISQGFDELKSLANRRRLANQDLIDRFIRDSERIHRQIRYY